VRCLIRCLIQFITGIIIIYASCYFANSYLEKNLKNYLETLSRHIVIEKIRINPWKTIFILCKSKFQNLYIYGDALIKLGGESIQLHNIAGNIPHQYNQAETKILITSSSMATKPTVISWRNYKNIPIQNLHMQITLQQQELQALDFTFNLSSIAVSGTSKHTAKKDLKTNINIAINTTILNNNIPWGKLWTYWPEKQPIKINIHSNLDKATHQLSLKHADILYAKALIQAEHISGSLDFRQPDFSLHCHIHAANNLPILKGNLAILNLGSLLQKLSGKTLMEKGAGTLQFSMQYAQSLQGKFELLLTKGTILNLDVGLGRLLNIFSLDSLQRRMSLKFNDIFNKNLIFDKIYGNLILNNQLLSIDKHLFINGPSANLMLSGDTNLSTKQLNIKTYIKNKAANNIPMAASLASGHPAIGAILWFAEKAKGKYKHNTKLDYNYLITGTWDKPTITKLH
jgi:hypothetical protein